MTDAELKKMLASAAFRASGDIIVGVAEAAGSFFKDWFTNNNKAAKGAIIENPPELKLCHLF
jgi:hypothetical protein